MTSVAELQTQISDHRNTLNQYTRRADLLAKDVAKEQPFHDRLSERATDVAAGTPNCKKISHDISHALRYKERKLKRFNDELVDIDKKKKPVAEKLTELEEISAEVQAQISSAEAAGTLPLPE